MIGRIFSKVRRELARLRRRVMTPSHPPAIAAYELTVTCGDLPLGSEAAIYLIYPTDGVQGSHIDALRIMAEDAVTPIVIANGTLSDDARTQLKPLCHLILERPNVGYDFGGYKDALLHMRPHISGLERVYLLNDSVWMLPQPTSWFAQVRARNLAFCGATSHYGVKRVDAHAYNTITWAETEGHRRFHYASYALAFDASILSDDAFWRFWEGYALSNSKKHAVKYGEVGLTQWVLKRGHSHGCTCPTLPIKAELAALSEDALAAVYAHLVIPEDRDLQALYRGMDPADMPRSQTVNFILTVIARQAIVYAMPYYTTRHRAFQFIKKSPLWLSPEARDATQIILSQVDGPAGTTLRAEAERSVQNRPAPEQA